MKFQYSFPIFFSDLLKQTRMKSECDVTLLNSLSDIYIAFQNRIKQRPFYYLFFKRVVIYKSLQAMAVLK